MSKRYPRPAFASLAALAVACSTGTETDDVSDNKQRILNGYKLDNAAAKEGAWLSIYNPYVVPLNRWAASGTLVEPNVVLTAAHVIDGQDAYGWYTENYDDLPTDPSARQRALPMAQRWAMHRSYKRWHEISTIDPDGNQRRILQKMSISSSDLLKIYTKKDWTHLEQDIGVDLALVYIDPPINIPSISMPTVECDASAVDTQFDLFSGGHIGGSSPFGQKNSWRFARDSSRPATVPLRDWGGSMHFLYAQPTRDGSGKVTQTTIGGDSGGGWFVPYGASPPDATDNRVLLGVHSRTNIAVHVAPYCGWFNRVKNELKSNADFDIRRDIKFDDKGNVTGWVERFVASISNSGVDVEVTAGGSGGSTSGTYHVHTVPVPADLRAVEVGTFDNQGSAVAYLSAGRLHVYHLDPDATTDRERSGLASVVEVDTAESELFDDLLVANTQSSGQSYNDLVGYLKSGQVVLFRGSASGLQRVSNAQVAITRVNDDGAADVVVAVPSGSGATLTVSSSSLNSAGTSNTVVSANLPIMPGQSVSGKFSRNTAFAGRDLAFIGSRGGGNRELHWCKMTSAGQFDGSCQQLALPSGQNPRRMRVNDLNGDEYADLVVTFEDPQEPAVEFVGGPSGLTSRAFKLVGWPTPAVDGTFALVGSADAASATPSFDFYVAEPVNATNVPTGDPLVVELFDLDLGGAFDRVDEGSSLAPCAQVFASPNPGMPDGALQVQRDESEGQEEDADFEWVRLFDSDRDGHYDSGSGVHWYHVVVKMSEGCGSAPDSEGEQFNAFKVRTNGQLRFATGSTLYGSDSIGEFASFEYSPNTDYRGQFDVAFNVGGVDRPEIPHDPMDPPFGITLEQADADDSTLDGLFAVNADGARDDTFFELYQGRAGSGTRLSVARTAGDVGSELEDIGVSKQKVDDASGDASGTNPFETHATLDGATINPGVHTWHWGNVGADNAIHLQPVSGSPINHEFIAPGGRWVSASVATAPDSLLQLDDETLQSLLPISLREGGFGRQSSITTVEAARNLLRLGSTEPLALLERELFALKLNVVRANRRGEPLEAAFVLSSRVAVSDLIRQGDALLTGAESELAVNEALRLMATANAGQTTFLTPKRLVLSLEDQDADGVMDAKDNCPMKANGGQEDSNADGIGDRCEPAPSVWCVEPDAGGQQKAVFGYESPMLDFRLPVGEQNRLLGEGIATEPPVLFRRGGERQAVVVPFTGESVTWEVMGQSATATLEAPRCSEIGAGSLACETSTSEFHCCTSIADCEAASEYALYATESLRLGERVRLINGDWTPGAMLSRGSIVMDAEAEAGNVVGGDELVIADNVGLFGDIDIAGHITSLGAQPQMKLRRTPFDAPDLSAFIREYAGTLADGLEVAADESTTLRPGSYGTTTIAGTVTLKTGDYYFGSLVVEDGAELHIDASSGPVVIHLQSSARLQGEIIAAPGELLIELNNRGEVVVSTDLTATVIAPEGKITFVRPGSLQTGAFYAATIEVASDITVLHSDPLAPRPQ